MDSKLQTYLAELTGKVDSLVADCLSDEATAELQENLDRLLASHPNVDDQPQRLPDTDSTDDK